MAAAPVVAFPLAVVVAIWAPAGWAAAGGLLLVGGLLGLDHLAARDAPRGWRAGRTAAGALGGAAGAVAVVAAAVAASPVGASQALWPLAPVGVAAAVAAFAVAVHAVRTTGRSATGHTDGENAGGETADGGYGGAPQAAGWSGAGVGRSAAVAGAVSVLLVVAVAGLHARAYAVVARGVPAGVARWVGTVPVLVLLVVGAGVLVAFAVSLRRRRNREREWVPTPIPVSRWSRFAASLAALAVFAAPIALLVFRNRGGTALRGPRGLAPVPGTGGGRVLPGQPHPATLPSWPWLIVAAVVLALIALIVVTRRRAGGIPAPGPDTPGGPAPADTAAFDAGLAALRDGGGDPRAAVLACYAALERTLTGYGAGPRPADTTMEVVLRGRNALGPDGEGDAAVLAGLFRRARYSTHPFGDADRDRARTALERVRARRQSSPS